MNFTRIAEALRALAAAIETPADVVMQQPPQPVDPTPAPRRGRPPKGAEGTPVSAPPAVLTVPTAPTSAAPSPAVAATAQTNLTHAALAPTFLAAAKTHGREFVIGVMKSFGAESFDKVPVAKLAEAKAAFERGPVAKPVAADGSDLLG